MPWVTAASPAALDEHDAFPGRAIAGHQLDLLPPPVVRRSPVAGADAYVELFSTAFVAEGVQSGLASGFEAAGWTAGESSHRGYELITPPDYARPPAAAGLKGDTVLFASDLAAADPVATVERLADAGEAGEGRYVDASGPFATLSDRLGGGDYVLVRGLEGAGTEYVAQALRFDVGATTADLRSAYLYPAESAADPAQIRRRHVAVAERLPGSLEDATAAREGRVTVFEAELPSEHVPAWIRMLEASG